MNGRDTNGRFGPGNQAAKGHGQGRPRRSSEEKFLAQLRKAVSDEDFEVIANVLVSGAMTGDVKKIQLLFNYLIGLPTQYFSGDMGIQVVEFVDADDESFESEASTTASQTTRD